jgi:hypothetical protein
MPPANGLAPLRIAGCPLRACCTKAPRVYCSCASCIAICTRRPWPVVQRRWSAPKIADRQQHTGVGAAQSWSRLALPPIALTGDRHCAAADQRDHIEGEIVLVRTAFADPFDLGIDEARIERAQLPPSRAQPLDRRRGKVFDKNIGTFGQVFDKGQPVPDLRLTVIDFLLALWTMK